MLDCYKVLGLTENATDDEIRERYYELRDKYSEERFLEGEQGNIAAKKLTEVETAYKEIISNRSQTYNQTQESKNDLFDKIESCLKEGKIQEAQQMLDTFDDRGAEWHYLQSVVFYKKNWVNESKKQLEIAIQLDPSNVKYKNSLSKLNERITNVDKNWNKSSTGPDSTSTASQNGDEAPQMGGNGCLEWCCEMAICNMILNCCCSCR